MSVLNTSTMANPSTSYYALKGEQGNNWWTFPSQTGQVLLQDPSGTQVLQAIGNDLFYNTELLAKASDIQDIADWALYPALADVNVDGKSLLDISSAVINNTLTTNVLDATSISNQSNIVTATLQVAGEPVPSLGQITTKTLASSGALTAGSLTTTGGLDMANTAITRASTVNISNSGFAPYGALTSPDGVALTWNGASINTGAAGNASQWANYPAVATINANTNSITNVGTVTGTGNITTTGTVQGGTLSNGTLSATVNTITGGAASTLTVAGGTGQGVAITGTAISETSTNGNISRTSYSQLNDAAGSSYGLTVDRGLNITAAANVDITAQNGSGGNIALNAQPGYQLGNQQVGFGAIQLNAYGSSNQLLGLGGKIDINAYSGGLGEYGSATSRVAVSAATIALSAGAVPTLPGTAGAMNIFGQDIISIVASLVPPVLPQFPQSVYIYGDGIPGTAGGVRLSSPNGVQLADNSELYATDIYPYTSNGLNLKGRASFPGPAADVTISDCASIAMRNAGTITGVVSINGVAYPPPAGLVEDWSTYPAVSIVDLSGQGITACGPLSGVSTINGAAYPPVVSSADWSQYPALQAVDISGFAVNNIGSITTPNGFTLTSAGSVGIFADTSAGDINIATNGGGNVNIGTGDAGDIYINTSGTGNNTTIGGDVVYLNATQGVQVSAPVLDMTANSIYNVATLRGSLGTDLAVIAEGAGNLNLEGTIVTATAPTKVSLVTPSVDVNGADIINVANVTNEGANVLTVQSTVNLIVSAETNLSLVSDTADVSIQGQTGASVYAATGNVSLTADSGEVIVQDSVLNMNTHKITNLSPGTAGTDAVNYTQLTFRDSTEFYVSSQGSDSNNGSILAPFLTIQAAITAAELISSAAFVCVINVASGHYTETLTFNKGYVTLNGSLQSQTGNEVCEITGSINIAVTGTSDLFNRQISFQGFNITCNAGQAVNDTSTTPHIVSFQDCKVFAFNQFFVSTSAAADMRLYMTNVEIQQTNGAATLPVISTNIGQIELERVDISLTGNVTAVLIGGTSILSRFSLSALDATSTATTLLPLLSFTSTTTSAHSLGNVAFAYESAVAKTATNAIQISSGVATAIIMLNCVFTLTGTASSTNYVVGYNGVGSPTIAGYANTSLSVPVLLPQTTTVQPGITQFQYTNIDPPVLGSYSSSIDQPMLAAGTPQALTFNTSQNFHGTLLLSGSRIYVGSAGNYQINYAATLINSSASAISGNIFLRKNGTTVANTGTVVTVPASNVNTQVSPQAIVQMNGQDYIEVWMTGPLTLSANATGAVGIAAATPSVILNIAQVR